MTPLDRWQDPEVQQWLQDFALEPPTSIALKPSPFDNGPTIQELALQIAGRQKAKNKLPTFSKNPAVLYPPSLSMEQCSSERTASWKGTLVAGQTFLDLTGGFGVDAFFISKRFGQAVYVEENAHLCKLAEHNLGILAAQKFQVIEGTAEDFLASTKATFDTIYIDPARRNRSGGKVFRLADCQPNVQRLMPVLRQRGKHVLIKASPILDIQQGLQELGGASKVVIVAFKNEVKELLFLVSSETTDNPPILTVNLLPESEETFEFHLSEEHETNPTIGALEKFVYLPNAALLKAGAFRLIGNRFDLKKAHINTHLYSSSTLVENFPGRVFELEATCAAQKKAIRKYIPSGKAEIATRNFPMKPEDLRKKLGLLSGGDQFIMGYTNANNRKELAVMTPLK